MRSETYSDTSHVSSSSCDDHFYDFSNSNCVSSDLLSLQRQISPFFLHSFSEFILCREAIWMLMGVNKLIFFYKGNAGYIPSEYIPSRFSTILCRICITANQILDLKSFCYSVLIDRINLFKYSDFKQASTNLHVEKLNEHYSTLTYQAFATSVRFFIRDILSELLVLERTVQYHDFGSILFLFDSLTNLTRRVSYFHALYSDSTLIPKNEAPLSSKDAVQLLLDILWKRIIESDFQIMSNSNCSSIVICVFLITIGPTFNFISQWLIDGIIHDKHQEFFIQQLIYPWNCDKLYTLWSDSCTLLKKNGLIQSPLFFLQLSSKILSSGKAISSLSYIGNPLPQNSIKFFYFDFINLLLKEIQNYFISRNARHLFLDWHNIKYKSFLLQANDEPFLLKTVYNIDSVHLPIIPSLDCSQIQDIIWNKLQHSRPNSISSPIFLVLQKTLDAVILPYYEISSTSLASHLRFNCTSSIHSELRMLFNLYLFGDSLTMQTFAEYIFETLENTVCLQDSLSLTNNLHKTLSYYHPQMCFDEKIFVSNKHLGNLNDIEIHFVIDSLASIVITPPTIQQYQHLFSFLLNLRWIEWILHRAKFCLKKNPQVIMQPFFIIHEMDFYVSIISQYFFHHIILVKFREFSIMMRSHKMDTDMLINEHRKFINSIFSKCFLDVDHYKFWKLFDQLFCMCSNFCVLLIDNYSNDISFNDIRRELHMTIKRLFTILRIPTINHKFEFLRLCLNFNSYISENIIM